MHFMLVNYGVLKKHNYVEHSRKIVIITIFDLI